MPEINYDKFEKSLRRLEERYRYYQENKNSISTDINFLESVEESCIQRFEICFEMLHVHLKKYLESEGMVDLPTAPKKLFRIAAQNKTIHEVEDWIGFLEKRNNSSHDYSGKKAKDSLAVIPEFIEDAKALLNLMIDSDDSK